MRLLVERFINELMTSNCYLVVDKGTKHCLCIDPASEKSFNEIEYIENHGVKLDYIILTHEHTDHTWGVNALKDKYPNAKIVCSDLCEKYAKKASRAYFLFYYNNPNYKYVIYPADVIIHKDEENLNWMGYTLQFHKTPGHSYGSMCLSIENLIFTGDTIMPFAPYFNSRDSSESDWKNSVKKVLLTFNTDRIIQPGHGDALTIKEWKDKYYNNGNISDKN